MKHVFAVSAYGKSPYLEECLNSLKEQREKSTVIVCTSTPNELIYSEAKKYGFELFIRDGKSSLKDDWNFCVDCASSKFGADFVTVAHQDDIYAADYFHLLKRAYSLYPDMLVFCSRYRTIDGDGARADSRAEDVKRFLRTGLKLRKLAHLKIIKRSALVFGNAICCPSCTYNLTLTGLPLFRDDDRFVTDWKTLLRLSRLPGRFVCCEQELIQYRIHGDTQTRRAIDDHTRAQEEAAVFESLWPSPVAHLLSHMMQLSYGAYSDTGDKRR